MFGFLNNKSNNQINISNKESINVVWYKLSNCPLLDCDYRIWAVDSASEFEALKRQNIGKTWIAADTDICLNTITGNDKVKYFIDNMYYRFGCKTLVNGNLNNIIDLSKCVTLPESHFDKSNPNHELSNPTLRLLIVKYNQYTSQKLTQIQDVITNELVNDILNELKSAILFLPYSGSVNENGKASIAVSEYNGSLTLTAFTDLDAIPESRKSQGYGNGLAQPMKSLIDYAQKNNLPMTINLNSVGGGFLVLSRDYPLILSSETSDKQKSELFLSDAIKYHKKGDPESLKRAVNCYFEAAKLNNSTAQNNLAVLLKSGYADVNPNPQAALYWFEKASDEIADAAFAAGRIYDLASDIKNAAYYYEKAAKMNHPIALYNIGAMYWNGDFYEKNPEKGYSCFVKSASLGYNKAQEILEKLK